jgi:5-methylcytosine-specific restriction protein A
VSNRQHGVSIDDRFFILKVGEDPRGLIASGTVVRVPFEDDHWDGTPGKTTNYVEVAFDRVLDPADVLPVELLESELPNTHWRPQGGGTSVAPEDEPQLEQLWETHHP